MAVSRRKSGGCTRGRFKRKKMGKGWLTLRKQPIGTRPVLKITPTEESGEAGSAPKAEAAKE